MFATVLAGAPNMKELATPIERLYITRDEADHRTDTGFELLHETLGHYALKAVTELDDADAMVVIGGDGAFLEAARKHDYSPLPVTGISTGTLNYYMSTTPDEASVDYTVRNLAEGDYEIHRLPLLELRRMGGELVRLAVNDIVIKAQGFQAFKAGLRISGTPFEHFVGSGLVCSTPQGSSGEGVANGGSFIREGLPVWTVIPEAKHPSKEYHSLVAPLILGEDDEIEIDIKESAWRPFILGTDGKLVEDWPEGEHELRIGISKDKAINRIRLNNTSYRQDVSRIFRGVRAVQ